LVSVEIQPEGDYYWRGAAFILPYPWLIDLGLNLNTDREYGWLNMLRFRIVAVVGAAFFAGAAQNALAADLPQPAPYPPPQAPATYVPAPPAFSWTGFYIGANAGYGFSNGSGTFTPGPTSFSVSGNGFLGGAQAGFNYQMGGLVIGMEADFQGSTGSGSLTTPGGVITATAKDPWFGTFRGRVGYAFNRFMIYGTGGGVYGNGTINGTSTLPGGGPFNNSATYVTWTAGAGVEYAFMGPVSAKLEYLYAGSPSALPTIPGVTGVTGSANTNIIRAGVNYHF
jgi:outer membrane immunogenic protein